jgi:tRNA(fMet)-specific endonuclease VapC
VGRRLILDTNVLIAYERGTIAVTELDDDDLAIAALTVAEYRVGIELSDTAERAADRSRALAVISESVEVLAYTEVTAAAHAKLLAHVRRTGRPRSAHDLIIAAHGLQTGRGIVTRDASARFDGLPGVVTIEASPA